MYYIVAGSISKINIFKQNTSFYTFYFKHPVNAGYTRIFEFLRREFTSKAGHLQAKISLSQNYWAVYYFRKKVNLSNLNSFYCTSLYLKENAHREKISFSDFHGKTRFEHSLIRFDYFHRVQGKLVWLSEWVNLVNVCII